MRTPLLHRISLLCEPYFYNFFLAIVPHNLTQYGGQKTAIIKPQGRRGGCENSPPQGVIAAALFPYGEIK